MNTESSKQQTTNNNNKQQQTTNNNTHPTKPIVSASTKLPPFAVSTSARFIINKTDAMPGVSTIPILKVANVLKSRTVVITNV